MTRLPRPSLVHTAPKLLTPSEVAHAFRVDPKTVRNWADTGKLAVTWTPGGTRRYSEAQVRAILGGAK